MKRNAFTLAELLIVIAVFAVLAALLLPCLTRALGSARAVVCVNNERNLTIAWLTYLQDNNGTLVGPHDLGYNAGWSAVRLPDWVDSPRDADGNYCPTPQVASVEDHERGIRRGALYPYVGDTNVYHCPDDKSTYSETAGIWRRAVRSYALPTHLNGGGFCVAPYVNVSQIRQTASTYMFVEEDTDPNGENYGAWTIRCDGGGWCDPIATRHCGRNAMTFVDGHGELHGWQDDSTLLMQDWRLLGAGGHGLDVRFMLQGHTHRQQ